MKAEHKHELKTNDLAKTILTSGDYVRVYGGRVALAIAIVVLLIFLLNQRISKSRATAVRVRDDLAYARVMIDRLATVSVDPTGQPTIKPVETLDIRKTLAAIQEDAADKLIAAEATLALGDYAWAMANYPEITIPTTVPTVYKPDGERPALLKEAKDAYARVINDFADQKLTVQAAHFGLAAVAEQSRDWSTAKKEYELAAAMNDVPASFKQLAEARLKRLEEIQKPLILGEVPDKPVLPVIPTTSPTTGPSTKPTTLPLVAPAATTGPAATTRPVTTTPVTTTPVK